MISARVAGRWLAWGGLLVVVSVALVAVREATEQTYVPITYLLIVLGGSASGGRRLGFALACTGFLVIDYYLQAPYDHISIAKLGDFITLAAFLVTAGVASELLDRARRGREEADRLAALREADRMKDFVLASVSHDLRTPLTTIKALAQDSLRTGESRAGEIEEQADRLTRLVEDLLDLSRLRAGALSVTPELNSAEDVIGAAIRQVGVLADGRRLRASLDAAAPALYGTFDFVQTLRVLVNLVENAARFTPRGGEVELTARREGGELVLGVLDCGPGVAPEARERIFDAFYRPAGAPADRGRAGLGLAIARTIADLQHGSVTHRDREGGGSVFELRLPAANADHIGGDES